MNVAIGWSGLSAYAARLIKQVPGKFPIIATRPSVPIEGMDILLPNRITWLQSEDAKLSWKALNLDIPQVYFQPSWGIPVFNQLGEQVLANGGQVILMFDNRWRGDLRQCLAWILFHSVWRKRFSAAWVAGASGLRLARFWGFQSTKIYTGMYGAAPSLFAPDTLAPLASREKTFIFVGQLITRKGVMELIEAWTKLRNLLPDWNLHVYGTGPLENLVLSSSAFFHGFQQPEQIAAAMRTARFLVLPSHEEHWGLVVCEAAQAGCGLILSDSVGSHFDLLVKSNGVLCKPKDSNSLFEAMLHAANLNDFELELAEASSRKLSHQFTPSNWAKTFHTILHDLNRNSISGAGTS